jgi:DNA-binding GntR family transcriptional regulator
MPLVIHRDRKSTSEDKIPSPSKLLLSEKVYQLFKRDIITGVLEPGRPLTEVFLTERFGASLTPVREACIRLNSEKLLESVPNKGYSVASISFSTILELFQVRSLLEEFTVQEACSKNNPELLGKIEALGQVVSRLGDRGSYLHFIDANFNLHLSIAKLAGNNSVVSMLADVLNQLRRLGYLTVAREDEGPQIAEEHAKIVMAIRNKDRQGAKKSIRRHIQSAKQNILNVYLK